ncbi:hypothetical protein [Chryseobacterium sp. ON_d1]|uniref:hypothetical protein n=1 Tax=Chryseobacterium sp. ON_d1 TaxID=2583211 RepID=UPI0011592E31|nr:hypothetical protein [Chryseobacterium sp. ON_d1]GEJ45535.1 hypothetical protein CRS_21430 [Chryseobacterium sp. ON_d1]
MENHLVEGSYMWQMAGGSFNPHQKIPNGSGGTSADFGGFGYTDSEQSSGGLSFTSLEAITFAQSYFGGGGNIGALFSMVEQLKKVGWSDPVNTIASFEDWNKIIKTDEISGLISKLYSVGGYKPGDRGIKFIETKNFLFHGKSNGFNILVNLSKSPSVLEYSFIIGHEVGHSITHYFRDIFFDNIKSNKNSPTARDAFSYFSEYISYSWESRIGNQNIKDPLDYTYNKHGAKQIPDIFRYPEAAINKFNNNFNIIMKAYLNWNNSIK